MEGVRTLTLREKPRPRARGDEKLVRVAAAGVCGSDMHAYLGHDERRPPPLILGHEAAGFLVNENGDGDGCDGDGVIVNPLVVCGECAQCKSGRDNLCARRQIISMPPREGAFAEYVALPSRNLLPLSPALSPQQGALAEPLACGHHAAALALRALRPPLPLRAAVLGGGAIGVAAALSFAARGAEEVRIAEANPLRRNFLTQVFNSVNNGDEESPPPSPMGGVRGGKITICTPDNLPQNSPIVADAVGNETSRALASELAAPGGVVVHIGLGSAGGGFNMRRLTLQEITLTGSYTYTAAEFAETAKWMATGKLGKLNWHETRPLSEAATVFQNLLSGKTPAPKVLLLP